MTSAAFACTLETNQVYRTKHDSCLGNFGANLNARITYPSLMLFALIEAVGSSVCALFVTLSLIIPCGYGPERKNAAKQLWERCGLATLSTGLTALGTLTPGLTSVIISLCPSSYQEEAEIISEIEETEEEVESDFEIEWTEEEERTSTEEFSSSEEEASPVRRDSIPFTLFSTLSSANLLAQLNRLTGYPQNPTKNT